MLLCCCLFWRCIVVLFGVCVLYMRVLSYSVFIAFLDSFVLFLLCGVVCVLVVVVCWFGCFVRVGLLVAVCCSVLCLFVFVV